ncbi:Triadin [Liparis tanakae]|uniref:Triadin n=1 Tax=Liparis tanakae TaxID=230148 RepID=A0A4Z2FMB4_9TELE|nr:Triadin [Liparis tanakae]
MPSSAMSSQSSDRGAEPPARTKQKTLLDDVILTFSSPMAWLLVVALVITWLGVAIVLFDLLNYNTLTGGRDRGARIGLPPPSAIAKKAMRARGKQDAAVHITLARLSTLRSCEDEEEGGGRREEEEVWLGRRGNRGRRRMYSVLFLSVCLLFTGI